MIIFPAIDIKDGKCVRLIKGDFNKITSYEDSPANQAIKYSQSGFNNIHIVDLDGALQGKPVNSNIVKEIVKNVKLKIQIGGGIRTIDDINNWVEMGVDKVVMSTAAVENTDLLKTACDKFKNKIAVALDVKDGLIALSGWKKQTNISAIDYIKKIQNFGVSRVIYTDINKDGTKKGPNIKDTVELSKEIKKKINEVKKTLPEGLDLKVSFNRATYINAAIFEVYKTLLIAFILVVGIIYLFLGNLKAVIVPAVALPVSLIASFLGIYLFGLSINIFVLLSFILAIGIITDDSVIMTDAIYRRIENGESPLVAAYKGSRQITFAIIATTLILVAEISGFNGSDNTELLLMLD